MLYENSDGHAISGLSDQVSKWVWNELDDGERELWYTDGSANVYGNSFEALGFCSVLSSNITISRTVKAYVRISTSYSCPRE